LDLKEFEDVTRSGIDQLDKPVFVITVDGGPDENPSYQKFIKVDIYHFAKPNLDALFISANSPCRSIFKQS